MVQDKPNKNITGLTNKHLLISGSQKLD